MPPPPRVFTTALDPDDVVAEFGMRQPPPAGGGTLRLVPCEMARGGVALLCHSARLVLVLVAAPRLERCPSPPLVHATDHVRIISY